MDPERRLCAHLASPTRTSLRVAAEDVLDWEDGATAAVVRCRECDGCALLELVDWSGDRRVRLFALSAIGAAEVALFQRDTRRGSCDPMRLELEQQALLASAGPAERLIARGAHDDQILASTAWPADLPAPKGRWQDRLPPRHDSSWFDRVGLAKT